MPADFNIVVPDNAVYGRLKQELIDEARLFGDDPPRLTFNDGTATIEVEYGFKEFMDRFPQGARSVRAALGLQADPRPMQDIFRDVLATPQRRQAYQDKENAVLDTLRGKDPQTPANPPVVDSDGDPKDALAGAMDNQPGLCLDDNHADPESKEMLIDGLEDLAAKGVTTLFIEHFWQEQQDLLDAYMNGAEDMELPPALAEAVRKLDEPMQGAESFKRLLAEAKKNGIRIVGLDSFDAKTPQDNDPRNWERRAARFNEGAAEVVEREKGGGKFLLMAGKRHNNTHDGGIPGLAQLLGVPTVERGRDGKLRLDPDDPSKGPMRSEPEQAFVDTFVDTFKAQQAALFQVQPPAGPMERAQATMRAAAVMKAATTLAKQYGDKLARLTPEKLREMAEQAADRAIAPIADGTLTLTSEAHADDLVRANAPSQAYTEAVNAMRAAAVRGPRGFAAFKAALAQIDDPRMLMESFDFKQGGLDLKGLSPLHIAAVCGDDAEVDRLLQAGTNIDARDDAGNTALHAVGFGDGNTDRPEVLRSLLANGADIRATNAKGQTAVHLAAFGGKVGCMQELAFHPDFANANVPDGRGWTPTDMATAAGQTALEDFMFDQGHATAENLLTPQEEQQGDLSTIDILVKASKWEAPVDDDGNPTETAMETEQRVRDMFTDLYRQPEFRTVLDIAAADALGSRSDPKKALRIYLNFNSDFAGTLTGKGGKGAFDDRSNTLVLAARRDATELKGTAIHEMTHHAADMVFGNQAVPYDDENSNEAVAYRQAIEDDFRVGQKFLGSPEKDIAYTIGGRMNEYRRANLGAKRLPMLQEYIVGVPQVIAEHGLEYAQKVAPNLTNFFGNEFAGKCQESLDNHPKFDRVIDNTQLIGGLAPVPPVDVNGTRWLQMSVINDQVKIGPPPKPDDFLLGGHAIDRHSALNGVAPQQYPNSAEYQSVQGLPRILDWSSPVLPTPEMARMSDANFNNILQRRFRELAADLPPEVSSDMLETLIGSVATDLTGFTADTMNQKIDTIMNKARDMVRQAKIAYLARAQETGALTPELVARTVIYESACQALENDPNRANRVPGAGPDMSDEKITSLVQAMTQTMTPQQMQTLATDPARLRQLATGMAASERHGGLIKTVVHKGFYTKSKFRMNQEERSHVSIDVKNARRTWVQQLAAL